MLSAVLCLVSLSLVSSDVTKLPDTSGIDFVLTEKLGVDKFFSLWLVFNNGDVKTSVVLSSTAENGEIEVRVSVSHDLNDEYVGVPTLFRDIPEVIFMNSFRRKLFQVPYKPPKYTYSSPMASLVLSDSSQLRADDFEKLPDQIIRLAVGAVLLLQPVSTRTIRPLSVLPFPFPKVGNAAGHATGGRRHGPFPLTQIHDI
uniref:Dolichyl-diphosphooligosaccharide--protein glycosyltransferase subunit 2 n=1 Tax=Timema tahoe TaxID=61484 RepID=A0A7R9IG08_9NEOP|nr:unnamed protein product [Timema tahoe]